MNILFKASAGLLVLCSSLYGVDYNWNSTGSDKSFALAANWSPVASPQSLPALTGGSVYEFIVSNYSTRGAAEIAGNLSINTGTINANSSLGTLGVVNIRSGNISCNRIQAGMRNTAGIVNIYGGAIQLNGMVGKTDTTGALRAYYGGTINFYGGTVEMDYAFWLSSDCVMNFYNAGGHTKAPNATSNAPIYAKRGVDSYGLKVSYGTLNIHLATGLNLAVNDVIYLIEYNGTASSSGFLNVTNNSVITVDGFQFRFEMARDLGNGNKAVALVALEAVDTRLKKGSIIMISQSKASPKIFENI